MSYRNEVFGPVALDSAIRESARTITVEVSRRGTVVITEAWTDPAEDETMHAEVWISPDQAEQLAALLLEAPTAARTAGL